MQDKYTFAAIFLLANFGFSSVVASIPEQEGDELKQPSVSKRCLTSVYPLDNVGERPTKEEMLKKIFGNLANVSSLMPEPVRFSPLDDETMSRTIEELFKDGR